MSIRIALRHAALGATCLASLVALAQGQSIGSGTAIPVRFLQSVVAGKSHIGDAVLVKSAQVVSLSAGRTLPVGSTLIGHVVESHAYAFNPAPYAAQQPSLLAIRFESAEVSGRSTPVTLVLRALAGPVATEEAETPHGLDEIDWSPQRTLIGGDTTSSIQKTIVSPAGNIVGYSRKPGLFARLIAASTGNPGSPVRCSGGETEQSVGIFSPDACGVYGLNEVSLAASGSGGSGTFLLRSNRRSIVLPAGSTALLEQQPR